MVGWEEGIVVGGSRDDIYNIYKYFFFQFSIFFSLIRVRVHSVSVVFGAPAAVAVSADAHAGHMLSDGRFFRSRLLLFLPNIVPSTLDTLFTPSLRLIGSPRSSCTARVSRNSEWNASDTPAKFSAALTS